MNTNKPFCKHCKEPIEAAFRMAGKKMELLPCFMHLSGRADHEAECDQLAPHPISYPPNCVAAGDTVRMSSIDDGVANRQGIPTGDLNPPTVPLQVGHNRSGRTAH